MKSILVAICISTMILSGCQSTGGTLIVRTPQVITIPDKFLICDVYNLPNSYTTNKEVARDLVHLYSRNIQCHNNAESAKKFQADAKKTTEGAK